MSVKLRTGLGVENFHKGFPHKIMDEENISLNCQIRSWKQIQQDFLEISGVSQTNKAEPFQDFINFRGHY